MRSSLSRRTFFWLTLSGLAAGIFAISGGDDGQLRAPAVSTRTAAERRHAVEAMRSAWQARPHALSSENERAERIFLNRLVYFVRSTEGSESSPEARRLWNECYRDHERRYSDFIASR